MKPDRTTEFSRRMMEKPKAPSLDSDPNARIFADPPEWVGLAFGGRQWFLETGCRNVHRIGIFKGLAWRIPAHVEDQDERGINGVRIEYRPLQRVYDVFFVHYDAFDPDENSGPVSYRIVEHRPKLDASQLMAVYAEVLGEHAV